MLSVSLQEHMYHVKAEVCLLRHCLPSDRSDIAGNTVGT